jgi:hypothetical protein
MTGDDVELIPERLRVDRQALARHHRDLPFQRQMIGVFRHGDTGVEFGRIATARRHLHRAWRGDHRAITRAPILLADVMLDLIREFDGRNAVGRFGLAGQLRQRAPAGRALAIRGCQVMTNLDDGKAWLTARAVPRLSRSRRRAGGGAGRRRRSL